MNAGLISQLEEYLTVNSSRHSFEIFAVQILGNLASQREYSIQISRHLPICRWLSAQLNSAESKELRNEILICLRNLLFHQDQQVTG